MKIYNNLEGLHKALFLKEKLLKPYKNVVLNPSILFILA